MNAETDVDCDEKRPLLTRSSDGQRQQHDTAETPTNYKVPRTFGEDIVIVTSLPATGYSADGIWIDTVSGQLAEHCHVQPPKDELANRKARHKLIVASVVCLVFVVGEAIGGILANSLAIATDAAHLLTDLTSFLISLVSMFIASRPATKRMSFGWYRAEVIGALLSVLLIWVVTAALVYMAVLRVINRNYKIDATIMLIMAALSVFFNICMGFILHDSGHAHSHGGGLSPSQHSHHDSSADSAKHSKTVAVARLKNNGQPPLSSVDQLTVLEAGSGHHDHETEHSHERNINVKAAFIHVVGDLLQSFGVLTAAFIIFYKPEWKLADPICTFIFSVLVLFTTITILRDILAVLMEAAPRGVSFREIREGLCSLEGVRELHDLRLWSLTTTRAALSVHLAIDKDADSQKLLAAANALVRDRFGISECTFQMEHYVSEMGDCEHCKEPSD